MREAQSDRREWADLLAEFETWSGQGVVNGNPLSARAAAYILAGHAAHHLRVLRDKYGI